MPKVRFAQALGVVGTAVLTFVLVLAAARFGHLAAPGENTAKPRTDAAASRNSVQWTGTWAASPQKPHGLGLGDVTLRLIIHTTIGGQATRIRLSNTFGARPVEIGSATVGVQSAGAGVHPGTLRKLTFNGGHAGATIAPGGQLTSDGVGENVPADANLAVSLYLPVYTGPATLHADNGSHQISYISEPGDHTGTPVATWFPAKTQTWFLLSGVDVHNPGTSAVVTLGDSITDGTHSTTDTNHRYPNWLADRLEAAGGPYSRLSVLNAGIGGNELLRTSACCGASPSALARLDTDVLDQSGVKDVIVMLGTNDILGAHQATAPQIIAGLRELITRVHARGIRIFGGTIIPSTHYNPAENKTRLAVNRWITASGAFDGVFDFATALADPADPSEMRPSYSSRDHLHPIDTGYHAMADAVNLPALLAPGAGSAASGGTAVASSRGGSGPRPCLVQPSFQVVTARSGIDATCPATPAVRPATLRTSPLPGQSPAADSGAGKSAAEKLQARRGLHRDDGALARHSPVIGTGPVEAPVFFEERVKLLSRSRAHDHPVRALARLLDLHLYSRSDAQLSYCHALYLTGLPFTLPPFQVHLSILRSTQLRQTDTATKSQHNPLYTAQSPDIPSGSSKKHL